MLALVFHTLRFILSVVLVVAHFSPCGWGSLNHVPSDRNLTRDGGEVGGMGRGWGWERVWRGTQYDTVNS